jgi:cell division protein FtsW
MATGAEDKPQSVLAAGLAATSRLLRRPLASYYLVLGSAGLLLTLGLIMVFSASSVYSLREFGSSYYLVTRQVAWVLAALPVAFLVSRLSPRTIRLLGLPLLLLAIALLLLTYVPGLGEEVRGNRNWIDFGGPFRVQPSELAKLCGAGSSWSCRSSRSP